MRFSLRTFLPVIAANMLVAMMGNCFANVEATVRYDIVGLSDLGSDMVDQATAFITESLENQGVEGTVGITESDDDSFVAKFLFRDGSCEEVQQAARNANTSLGDLGTVTVVECRNLDSVVAEGFSDTNALGNSWYHSPWFGNFHAANFPWIYTEHSGWIYTVGNDSSLYGFLTNGGWIWTAKDVWPYAYSFNDSEWYSLR